jgi:hypothetical protein
LKNISVRKVGLKKIKEYFFFPYLPVSLTNPPDEAQVNYLALFGWLAGWRYVRIDVPVLRTVPVWPCTGHVM